MSEIVLVQVRNPQTGRSTNPRYIPTEGLSTIIEHFDNLGLEVEVLERKEFEVV